MLWHGGISPSAGTRASRVCVTLEGDPTQDQRDCYGRLLAHVFVRLDGEHDVAFAMEMIAEGYAHHYVCRVPTQYARDYDYVQADAQANIRGLWSPEACNGMAFPKRGLEEPALATVAGAMVVPSGIAETPTNEKELAAAPVAVPVATPVPMSTTSSRFDPSSYIGKGDAFNCNAFNTQADAQAVLRADFRDPNRLDTDRDGIAFESERGPIDRVPVAQR